MLKNQMLKEQMKELMQQKEELSKRLVDATQVLVRTPELQAMQLDKRRNQLKQIQVQAGQQPTIPTAEAAR